MPVYSNTSCLFNHRRSFRRILRDNALKSIQVLCEQSMPGDKYGKFPKKLTVSGNMFILDKGTVSKPAIALDLSALLF